MRSVVDRNVVMRRIPVITYVLNEQNSQMICKDKQTETLSPYSKQQNILRFQKINNNLYTNVLKALNISCL